jgi:antitoxin CptB
MTGASAVSEVERRRLRWRARRGLLENDLLIGRFLDRHEGELQAGDVAALKQLLDLPDNDLLDLLLSRKEPAEELDTISVRELVARIRAA